MALPVSAWPEVLFTRAVMLAVSPQRMNRGILGCTIRSLCTVAVASTIATSKLRVWASPKSLHDVRLSGNVKAMDTLPSASVRRAG